MSNAYTGNAGSKSYTLKAFKAHIVICSSVGVNNVYGSGVYIVVPGASTTNTGTITTLLSNNYFALFLDGLTLTVTSNTFYATAILEL